MSTPATDFYQTPITSFMVRKSFSTRDICIYKVKDFLTYFNFLSIFVF